MRSGHISNVWSPGYHHLPSKSRMPWRNAMYWSMRYRCNLPGRRGITQPLSCGRTLASMRSRTLLQVCSNKNKFEIIMYTLWDWFSWVEAYFSLTRFGRIRYVYEYRKTMIWMKKIAQTTAQWSERTSGKSFNWLTLCLGKKSVSPLMLLPDASNDF